MSISSNQMETWLFSQVTEFYEPNHVYVDEMFDLLLNWMEQNGYGCRTDENDLYHNFCAFLYKSSMSSNYHKQRRPVCFQI